jgi:protein-disulfide isomerase
MAKLKVPVGPDDHVQGPADAPVTLVEYGDYECPHCGHAYPIVKALQKRFGKQLRFAFRNFPLREIHPYAEAAAESAEFAATHGKFWEMHDLIFENQNSLSEQMLGELAQRLTLIGKRSQRHWDRAPLPSVCGGTFLVACAAE